MLKKFLRTGNYNSNINISLLLLRVSAGTMMFINHGMPKFNKLLAGGEITFSDPIGLGSTVSFVLSIFSEFLCSVLLVLGITTRLTVIPLIIQMSVAAFVVHLNDPFAKKEMALLYLIIFVAILIAGAGKYSVDNLIFKKK